MRAAWRQARHGTRDHGHARRPRDARGLGLQRRRHGLAPMLVMEAGIEPVTYFETAAMIIGLILAGRWLEARARSQAGGAVRGPRRAPGADGATRRRRTRRSTCPSREVQPGRPAAGPAGREGARWTASSRRAPRAWTRSCSPASRCRSRRRRATRSSAPRSTRPARSSFRATRVGRDTVLAQIVRMVREAPGLQGAHPAPRRRASSTGSCRWSSCSRRSRSRVWLVFGPQPRSRTRS